MLGLTTNYQLRVLLRVLCAFVVQFIPLSLSAADWPQWRGPEGTGVSPEKQLPIIWHEDRSIVWKSPLPEWGTSTPAIWGDAIFVTSHTAENKLLLVRIDKKTGKTVWTQEVG